MARALEGVRVVDLSHVLAAPTATMFLADLGAEVIHVEPARGDDAREFGPFIGGHDPNRSAYFISLNRNKKSLVLDLKADEGKEILRALIAASDVLVENFRPDTMRKLGFDWPDVQRLNPGIVYCSVCGFGHDSLPELASRPAYDMVAQAYSGLMSVTGPEGGPPCRVGSSMGDIVGGHQAAIAILAALLHRQRTGKGQHIDISLVDSLFSVLENAVARYLNTGEIPAPLGTAHPSITPFQAFETRGGSWIIVAVGNDKLWAAYCRTIGRAELIDDPRFKTNPLRTEHRPELTGILQAEMARRTLEQWIGVFEREGIPCSPINDLKRICEDRHIAQRGMVVEVQQPRVGPVKMCASPLRMSETPGEVYAPAPLLGEHSEEVLRTVLGYSPERIRRLEEEGVVNRSW